MELKGVKLVPPVQKFDLRDKKFDPLWKQMIDLNVPLWTHGRHQVSTAGSVAKSDHPLTHWNQIIPAVKQLPISAGFKEKISSKNAQNLLSSFNIL